MVSKHQQNTFATHGVASASELDPAAIEANRSGRLTSYQQERLHQARRGLWGVAVISIFMFIIAQVVVNAILPVIGGLVIVVLLYQIAWKPLRRTWQAYTRDMQNEEIEVLQGQIRVQLPTTETYTDANDNLQTRHVPAKLYIGNRTVAISNDLMVALEDGQDYIAYFAKHSGLLLSIEPLLDHKVKNKRDVRLGGDGELIYDQESNPSEVHE
ncbi:MAG: hypothetical protein OHK0023_06280 [Anaerolineae bacterium]